MLPMRYVTPHTLLDLSQGYVLKRSYGFILKSPPPLWTNTTPALCQVKADMKIVSSMVKVNNKVQVIQETVECNKLSSGTCCRSSVRMSCVQNSLLWHGYLNQFSWVVVMTTQRNNASSTECPQWALQVSPWPTNSKWVASVGCRKEKC